MMSDHNRVLRSISWYIISCMQSQSNCRSTVLSLVNLYVQTQPHDVLSLFQPVGQQAKNRLFICVQSISEHNLYARPSSAARLCMYVLLCTPYEVLLCMYTHVCMYYPVDKQAFPPRTAMHSFLRIITLLAWYHNALPLLKSMHVCFIYGVLPRS